MKNLYNKIINWISYGGRSLHEIVGSYISIFIYIILKYYTLLNDIFITLIIFFIVLIIMIYKELYDKYIKKTFFDITDIIAGILFPLFMLILFGIFKLISLI